MSTQIQFILNNRDVITREPAGLLVLDFLRRREKLTGTKEGCKEGDCGACMVLVGELAGDRVKYKPVTSCLLPLGEMAGKHLVTIEGLNRDDLSPVQSAIVTEGGSQCGFCTPGIVVSLTGYLMQSGYPLDEAGIKYALGGNLCRCTGYSSLMRAGKRLIGQLGSEGHNGRPLNAAYSTAELIRRHILPEYFANIPKRLPEMPEHNRSGLSNPDYFVAGGTDIYVRRGDRLPDSRVRVLNLHPEMKGIRIENQEVRVGALTTFEEFARHPEINRIIPGMQTYNLYNASWQIRNRATLGGNIINASPIGDMTILLLALDSRLVLQGRNSRQVALKSFFKGYKILDKKPFDILTEIIFPVPPPETHIHFEKISKRKALDIAAVNSAVRVKVDDGTITDIDLAFGGVAPVPLHPAETITFLQGRPLNRETIRAAIAVSMTEISPISDIRGSAAYKRLLVRQIIIAHFCKLYPELITAGDFYEIQ